jgi:hypothetical protein
MAEERDRHELLMRAVDTAGEARTLDDFVRALVDALQALLDLWQVSVVSVAEDGESVRLLATWSVSPSVFTAGTEVAGSITPELQHVVEDLLNGEIVETSPGSRPESLVDHLLAEQGIAQTLGVPVHRDGHGVLALAFGSTTVGPLRDVGEPFFRGLAAGLEETLARLATAHRSNGARS